MNETELSEEKQKQHCESPSVQIVKIFLKWLDKKHSPSTKILLKRIGWGIFFSSSAIGFATIYKFFN